MFRNFGEVFNKVIIKILNGCFLSWWINRNKIMPSFSVFCLNIYTPICNFNILVKLLLKMQTQITATIYSTILSGSRDFKYISFFFVTTTSKWQFKFVWWNMRASHTPNMEILFRFTSLDEHFFSFLHNLKLSVLDGDPLKSYFISWHIYTSMAALRNNQMYVGQLLLGYKKKLSKQIYILRQPR